MAHIINHRWVGGMPKTGKTTWCKDCGATVTHQLNHVKVYTAPGSDLKVNQRPNCIPTPMPKEKMKVHNLDVQQMADMLEKDNCPASMGAFTYPDGSDGLLMICAKPEYAKRISDFLQTLYDEVGYVSPKY